MSKLTHFLSTRIFSALFAVLMCSQAHAAPIVDPGTATAPAPADGVMTVALKPTLDTSQAVLSRELWDAYRDKFVSADGRVIDDGNAGVSHSEGQGYGMLLAAFADDPVTFQKLWGWTAKELYIRGDNLAAWRWRETDMPHVMDKNNATDGDLLIAWALSEAANRWKNPEYRANAHKIALEVGRLATTQSAQGKVLSPGVNGFGAKDMKDGPVINLSYWVFPAIDALKNVAPEIDWISIKQNGLRLIKSSSNGPSHLPPDWLSLQDGNGPAKDYPAQFGYDAIRIPLYLAWGSTADREALSIFNDNWRRVSGGRPSIVDANTGRQIEIFADEGYQAVVALTRCATEGVKFPAELMNVKLERYYSSTLHMLSLVVAGNRYSKCF